MERSSQTAHQFEPLAQGAESVLHEARAAAEADRMGRASEW